ncbi:splicing factor Cactin isoform X2 [Rhinichthys klamathensis goyatoka]|uniref:splicing factor Cactin isoform X2 n=1 Tax=Rhinichthys klamathensis goyatoka TaxID=3034132 RepID=UPI0024B60729|nr:splicing factor Cactin isoform X2 [Rhinichthys klamathensis goyatoka]
MGSKKHRRSRSRSCSQERSRRHVRSPEDRRSRNRSPVKGSRRRRRSDSGGSRSSGGSAGPSRHRGRESGHSSESDRDHRDRRARSHGRSKDRDSSSGDNHNDHKKHKMKMKHKDEKGSSRRRRSRSLSRSSTDSSVERERERRRRQSRSPSRERGRRQSKERERDRCRRSESRSSSSSCSSVDSDQGGKTAQGPSTAKEETKKKKEMMKALETPEEKRARRLAKKEAKERKKREKMGWSEEYMGYTNADNPFGDNNLLGTFKWQKALEMKGIGHLSEKNLKERNKHIQEENRRELQKVKQLRLEREREKSMREQELEMLQREKEAEHFKTWAEQEDNFHLHQAKLRSKIRIRDGRAKPIDLLAKYISAEDDDLSVEMHEPYTFLNGLTATDMEDLLEDIKVYMELEQGKNVDFWRDMTTITEDEISKLRKMETSGKGPGDRREGINTSVSTDVQSVFKGKTYSQLQALYMNIESKIQAGGSNLDIGYWESLLQQVRVYMARARLRERHQDVLRQKLYKLKQEQGVESEPLFPIIKEEPENERPIPREAESADEEAGSSQQGVHLEKEQGRQTKRKDGEEGERSGRSSPEEKKGDGEEGEKDEAAESVLTEEDLIQQSQAEYDSGRYSPTLLQPSELPLDTHIMKVEEDLQRLLLARRQLQVTGDANESAEDAFVRRAKEGMSGDEAQFSVEMPLTGKMYLWADKYRPRKPRFFNRVHTGFEWNKYNQTHYDFDNPPPKIVQGYKFNIFYPDLIDKRSTPQYFLEPSPDNKDFGILRFHAGPPYEDIAFKIVNREWEYSHRHGFRCQFANGIFQLWFHFKRYRYRR